MDETGSSGDAARTDCTVNRERPPGDATESEKNPRATDRHPAGACRIGADERSGAVDAHGCVFGLSNLYLAGASTFPTSGTAHPTLTVDALALRMAERFRASLTEPAPRF